MAEAATRPTGLWTEVKDVALDSAGHVSVADPANDRIRRIDEFGAVTTVAGLPLE